jgi:serine/threonine protein kinase
MGDPYRARDTQLACIVAIKILRDTHSDLLARFAREAKAIAALTHPHICTLFDIGHEQGTEYLVMEHLRRSTTLCRRRPRSTPRTGQASCIAWRRNGSSAETWTRESTGSCSAPCSTRG